jgi:hypothetical protein
MMQIPDKILDAHNLNAARLWTEFSSDQKQRLQKVLFPQGMTFADGIYKTHETCLFFKLL